MAFNIKKRHPAPQNDTPSEGENENEDLGIGIIGENPDEEPGDTMLPEQDTPPEPPPFDDDMANRPNVVATQPWVYNIFRQIWNWTKFFATRAIRVAGPIHAQSVKAHEIQADNAFATRFTLIDRDGRPAVVFINERGELAINYDFKNVYVYSGAGDIDIRKYVYRHEDVAANFIGLTQYETQMNFIPFQSAEYKEFNEKMCYKICPADGENELVGDTFLVTCNNQLKRIWRVKVVNENAETIKVIPLPGNSLIRKLTINMPCFVQSGEPEQVAYVGLPEDRAIPNCNQCAALQKPLLPPFLVPPKPFPSPYPHPPTPFKFPLNDAIFDEQLPDDDIFSDDGSNSPEQEIPDQYKVEYRDYITDTYCNITLKKSDFQKNVEQYLVVETMDA